MTFGLLISALNSEKKGKISEFFSFISWEWLQIWYVASTASIVNIMASNKACMYTHSVLHVPYFLMLPNTLSCVLIMTHTSHARHTLYNYCFNFLLCIREMTSKLIVSQKLIQRGCSCS